MFLGLKKNLKTQHKAKFLSNNLKSSFSKNPIEQGQLKKPECSHQQNGHHASFANPVPELQINNFLNKVHQRISWCDDDSCSEIIEQSSFDWDEGLNKNQKIGKQENGQGRNRDIWQKKQQIRISDELIILSEIQKLQDFLKLLGYINANIAEEIERIINQNNGLKQENGLLKYRQCKTIIKMQLYENQIMVMQKKNLKLLNDISDLKKQIQQLQKNNKSLKNLEIQCNGNHPKISVYLKQIDFKASQKQLGEDFSQINIKLPQLHLSPISTIEIPFKQKLAQPQIKMVQNERKLKVNKQKWKQTSTNISMSTKNSSSTKNLSNINQNGFNIMISQIKAYSNKFLG